VLQDEVRQKSTASFWWVSWRIEEFLMFEKAFEQAKLHARDKYPEEMCGFVIDGEFVKVDNAADDPATHKTDGTCACRLCAFRIGVADTVNLLPKAQMVLHSHPNGPAYPSKSDMEGQFRTALPWGVICVNESSANDPEIWGDSLPIEPLIGRDFLHCVRDCYSLIRDTFRLGSEELKRLDVTADWPFDPVVLKDFARDDGWWAGDDDLYSDYFQEAGFVEIDGKNLKPGDCFMLKIRSNKFNHAGMLIADDLILHHLPNRLSRREPSGIWSRAAEKWVRYVG
jgi:proteasome lid subunit RPN8/RPN11